MDWRGEVVVYNVDKRYRDVPVYTCCTLCRQLHAPWIERFMEGKRQDLGDQIRIFRNLRHLPHVNDFQSSRNALREHNAPYHVAVVPVQQKGWRNEFERHIARNGMVAVMPEGLAESRLFAPQLVPSRFDPDVVQSWLNVCKGHTKRCNPKTPEVQGMRLIDCESKDLIMQPCRPNDKYVALSYVWGEPKNVLNDKLNALQLDARTSPQAPKQKEESIHKKTSAPAKASGPATRGRYHNAAVRRQEPALTLPEPIPLTIRDAIRVTKDLGYRFLWVDRYCIDQNNQQEKRIQVGRMGDIYGGSQMTIVALGANSDSGLPGVSRTRRSRQWPCTTMQGYTFVSTMPDPHYSISCSKWYTRGWTYQEGFLSTRRLFFTQHQVYYECNGMNCVESFKSDLKALHTQDGQRFRAYHRAGQFVCGNSNKYSHLNVSKIPANHRKVDIIRRCQHQISQYSKRELTNENDILRAFAGIPRFYATTTAKIISLAGLPIPFPLAQLPDIERERLDHLSYALAWEHPVRFSEGHYRKRRPDSKKSDDPPYEPAPPPASYNIAWREPRAGFPSWSWAGWFGGARNIFDLPYCWTSYLDSVKIGFGDDKVEDEDYALSKDFTKPVYKQYLLRKYLSATVLYLDAIALYPEKLELWRTDPRRPHMLLPSDNVLVYMSAGPSSLVELRQQLLSRELECLTLGTYGTPRKDVYRAIRAADKQQTNAKINRIALIERPDTDAIVCLIVRTVEGISYRVGLLEIGLQSEGIRRMLEEGHLGVKKSFVLK